MIPFRYHHDALYCESVPLTQIAEKVGTPVYVYSRTFIENEYRRFDRAFGRHPHLVCYSVKANSNLSVLKLLAKAGAGFDIVSGGELQRVLKAGGDPAKVVFSGVGKTATEMDAALRAGILKFNVESQAELELIEERAARLRKRARCAVRVNPDVRATTHPYISTGLRKHKFGVDISQAEALYERAKRLPHLEMTGVSFHIGSQILDLEPFLEALDRAMALAERLRRAGFKIRYLDVGGGLGVPYRKQERHTDPVKYIRRILKKVGDKGYTVLLEPGRRIVAEAGLLLTRVLYCKSNLGKNFIIVDAAMNDLLRPALYGAYHEILPVARRRGRAVLADIVGPVCETGDFLARDRQVGPLKPTDLLTVTTTGAYGSALASNYNSRFRPAEVLVENSTFRIIRRRELVSDLLRTELPFLGS